MTDNKISRIEQVLVGLAISLRNDPYADGKEYASFRGLFPLKSDGGKNVDKSTSKITSADLNEFFHDPHTPKTLVVLLNRYYRWHPEIIHRIINSINENPEAKNGMSQESKRIFERFEKLTQQKVEERKLQKDNQSVEIGDQQFTNFYENRIANILKTHLKTIENLRNPDKLESKKAQEYLSKSDSIVRAIFRLENDGGPDRPVDQNTKSFSVQDLNDFFSKENQQMIADIAYKQDNRQLPNRILNAMEKNPDIIKKMLPKAKEMFKDFKNQVAAGNEISKSGIIKNSEQQEHRKGQNNVPKNIERFTEDNIKKIQLSSSSIQINSSVKTFEKNLRSELIKANIIKSDSNTKDNPLYKEIMNKINKEAEKKIAQLNQKTK